MDSFDSALPAGGATPARGVFAGIFLLSAATLLLELALTRIFDVILWNNLAYLFVGSALFGFGLGGLILFRWPVPTVPTARLLAAAASAFALSVVLIVPTIMLLPIDLGAILHQPFRQLLLLGVLYVSLVVPFVISGVAIAGALARHSRHVHRLYFCDLVGAGFGCLGIFVLPQLIGGEETLFAVAAIGLAGAAMFAPPGSRLRVLSVIGTAVTALIAVGLADRITFPHLITKRGVTTTTVSEFSYWDPVSKIDVKTENPDRKRIIYDGGAQSSAFYRFDGNLAGLRETYFTPPEPFRYNSGRYIALSHWLQRDQGGRVLVIGSAGGQETLAALTWGAGHVDAVDMVCAVIEAARGRFAAFIGGIYSHPRVSAVCDEGRSFLRRSEWKYDIIQIHSNHTTASLANGSGAAMPIYLQTVEAYKDYFKHLTPNGILQINYFIYPKMVATAAQAWSELFPGEDFHAHLLITDGYSDGMKTFMVKHSPWTAREIAEVRHFLSPGFGVNDPWQYRLIYAPGEPEARNVPDALFRVPLDPKLVASLPYRIEPSTDDEPFFRHLRKGIQRLTVDEAGFIPEETAAHINAPLHGVIPLDFVHVYVIGGLSVIIAAGLLLVPLLGLRQAALTRTEGLATLLYFGCLGIGFVVVELVLIYKFMLVIGPPIHAMAAVIFAMLVGAGIGSGVSNRIYALLGQWAIAAAVVAFAALMVCLLLAFPALDRLTLELQLGARLAIVLVIVVLIGVPLGMPFPLGLAALSLRSPDLIPWGWAINALMTVVGSLLAVVLSIGIGYTATLVLAIGIYALAGASYLVLVRGLARASKPLPVSRRAHLLARSSLT
jgi:spermidine synthase